MFERINKNARKSTTDLHTICCELIFFFTTCVKISGNVSISRHRSGNFRRVILALDYPQPPVGAFTVSFQINTAFCATPKQIFTSPLLLEKHFSPLKSLTPVAPVKGRNPVYYTLNVRNVSPTQRGVVSFDNVIANSMKINSIQRRRDFCGETRPKKKNK